MPRAERTGMRLAMASAAMKLHKLGTLFAATDLLVGLLASGCAPAEPDFDDESAMSAADSEALQQDTTQGDDGEMLEDADEDGPFPSVADEAAPDAPAEPQAEDLGTSELADSLDMDENDWANDDRDEFDRLQMISIASEPLTEMSDIDVAEEQNEAEWLEQPPPDATPPDDAGLDTGSGPTLPRSKAAWAEGRIIRISPDGAVVGWACDTRRAKEPMVAIVSLRDDKGMRTRSVVLADQTSGAEWASKWIKDKCKGQPAHLFRAQLDKTVNGKDKIVLKLVGHDATRVLLEKRVFRHTPIGAVTRFKVGERAMKKVAGWACDMDTPGERVTVELVSNRGLERKEKTSDPHGRKIHLKCSGGTKHRFHFDLDRKVPCGKDEVFRVFAYNTGDVGKNRVLLGKRTVHGGSCVDPTPDTVKELAQSLLASPNVSFPYTNDARVVLQQLAAGHQAPVFCSNNATGTGTRTTVSIDMMRFLYEMSKKGSVPINALTDRCHTAYSNHYRGRAVDFSCSVNLSLANSIAAKYGGAHNFESCAANAHWHFDF